MDAATGFVALATQLDDVDVPVADAAQLADAVAVAGRARAWLDAFEVAVARRAAVLAAGAPAASVTETLGDRGRRSGKDTSKAKDRAGVCDRMPGVEAALQQGAITAGHVDAIANATRNLDDATKSAVAGFTDDLIAAASAESVAEFETEIRDLVRFLSHDDGTDTLARQKRDRSVRTWIDKTSGMHHLHATLDPEAGQKLFTALQHQLSTVCQRPGSRDQPLERLRADALTELVTTQPDGAGGGERRVPEIVVLIDWQTLRDGVHAAGICETDAGVPLPVSTVRRLACEANVLPIVLGADGQPLDCGRSERVANRAQRRALAALYRTCVHPDCDVPFSDCEIHHVISWERFGPTDFVNLVPTCRHHHTLVHEGRWILTMTPDRVITLRRPDHSVYFEGRTTDRWPVGRPVPTTQAELHRALRRRPPPTRATASSAPAA